ncbi:MAG: hypothetical protein ACR2LS_06565 [Thermomicrobiales bacterium]
MDIETLGIVAAGIGVVATIAYLVLGVKVVRSLRDIRDQLQRDRTHDERT